jgi:hypothetical protein
MKRKRRIEIPVLFVIIITFASECTFSNQATIPQPTTIVPSNTNTGLATRTTTVTSTATPTKTKPVNPKDFHLISASRLLNDDRIWAMTANTILDEGSEDTGCKPVFQTGDLYQSDDGGHSWNYIAPPITFSLSGCPLTTVVVDLSAFFEIVPYANGIIMHFRLLGHTSIFLWDENVWSPIPPPFPEVQFGDPKEIGVMDMLVIPDESGRIVAVGHSPDGKSNAWIQEKPTAAWKDISSNIGNYATINQIMWSYAYGIFGMMKKDSLVIKLDDELHWIDLKFPKENKPELNGIGMGINGEVCTSLLETNINHPRLVWDGSNWIKYNFISNCLSQADWLAYQRFSVVQLFPLVPGDPEGLFYITNNGNQLQKLVLPSSTNYLSPKNLAISQSGNIYYLSDLGVYSSKDIGKTWELVYG